MGDEPTTSKKRKPIEKISYSKITASQANKKLGFRVGSLKGISVGSMLANEQCEGLEEIKEKVYDRILEYIEIEGYPTEGVPDFKQSSINHLVYSIISPIIRNFRRKSGRQSVQLRSEKGFLAEDGETGGEEEFAVVDLVSEDEEVFIFIIEAKTSSVGKAMRLGFLAMKDARDGNNKGQGVIYGFITTGEDWRMVKYDGKFQITEKFTVLWDSMDERKDEWMKRGSIVVDCINCALSNGGMVKKDVTD